MNQSKQIGFTLIEILIVMAIVGTLSVLILNNFGVGSKGGVAQRQIASIIISDVRRAQSMALAGTTVEGVFVCAFGVHYVDMRTYVVYASNPDEETNCADFGKKYSDINSSNIIIIEKKVLPNNNIEIDPFFDVLFELPNALTYVNGASHTISKSQIKIYSQDESNCELIDDFKCTYVEVYQSGKIDLL